MELRKRRPDRILCVRCVGDAPEERDESPSDDKAVWFEDIDNDDGDDEEEETSDAPRSRWFTLFKVVIEGVVEDVAFFISFCPTLKLDGVTTDAMTSMIFHRYGCFLTHTHGVYETAPQVFGVFLC